MSVHYKFKSSLDYDTLTFDGLHISVGDLKKSIIQQKKIGKSSDFDLQITNAQTKEVYKDDETLIPKNSSVIVARIPITGSNKKVWDRGDGSQQTLANKTNDASSEGASFDKLAKTADLTAINASEDDKIKAMMTQATQDYDPSKYMKIRGMTGPIPPTYTCYRCGKPGHWIKNCPTNTFEVKRSTGIPRSFMVTVEGPEVPGALLTNTGQFAVPVIDHEAYREGKKEKPPFAKEPTPEKEVGPTIPDELLCMICRDLLSDAVLIPCCGNSYCDECVRQALLDSEEHECPTCHEKDISPDTLIPNRFLRTAVMNFKNETGYTKVKKIVKQPSPIEVPVAVETPTLTENESNLVLEADTPLSDDRPGTPVRDENPEGVATADPPAEVAPVAPPTTIPVSNSGSNQSGFTISTITTRIQKQQYPSVMPGMSNFRPTRPPRNIHPYGEPNRGPPPQPPIPNAPMQQMPRPYMPKQEPPPHYHHHHHHHSRFNPPGHHPYGSGPPPYHANLPPPPPPPPPPPRSGPPHLMSHPLLPLPPMHMPHHYPSSQIPPSRGMPPRGPPGYATQPPPPGSLPLGPPPYDQPPPPGIPPVPVQHPGYDYYRDHKGMRDKGKNPFAEFERELMEYKDHPRPRSRSSSRSYGPSRSSSRSRSHSLSRSLSHSSRSSSRSRSYSYSRSRSISMSRSRSRSRSPYRSRARSRSRSRRYSPHYRRSSRSPYGKPRSPLRREYSPGGYYNVYRYQAPMSTNFSPDQRGRFYQHSYRMDDTYHHYNEHRYENQEAQFNPRFEEPFHDKRRSWTPDDREKGRSDGRKSLMRKDEDQMGMYKEKSGEKKRDQKRHKSKSKKEKEHETKPVKDTNQTSGGKVDVIKNKRDQDEQMRSHKRNEKHDSETDLKTKEKKHKMKSKKNQDGNKIKTSTKGDVDHTKESVAIKKREECEETANSNNGLKCDPELKMKHVIKEADSTNVVADSTMEESEVVLNREKKMEKEKIDTPEPDSAGEVADGITTEDDNIGDFESGVVEMVKTEKEIEIKDVDESVLVAHIPELSKWERDESDVDTPSPSQEKKHESPKTLSRDIVQRAEKAILQKAPKPSMANQKAGERKSNKDVTTLQITISGRDRRSVETKDKLEQEEERLKSHKSEKFKLDRSKFQEKSIDDSPTRSSKNRRDSSKGPSPEKESKKNVDEKVKEKASKRSERHKHEDEKRSRKDKDEVEMKKKEIEKKNFTLPEEKKADIDDKGIFREKRKPTIDESKFEPNYDETSDSDAEKFKKIGGKKRSASISPDKATKKLKDEELNVVCDKTILNEDVNLAEFTPRSGSVSTTSSASPSSDRSQSPQKRDKSHKHKKTKHKKHRKHKHKHKKKKSHKSSVKH